MDASAQRQCAMSEAGPFRGVVWGMGEGGLAIACVAVGSHPAFCWHSAFGAAHCASGIVQLAAVGKAPRMAVGKGRQWAWRVYSIYLGQAIP